MCLQSMSPVSLESAAELKYMTCGGILFVRLSNMQVSSVSHLYCHVANCDVLC